ARGFSPDEQHLCAALADQVALALHNARLLQYERRARDLRQALLRQVGTQFHATLDPEQLLPIVFADVNRVLDSEGLSLWMVDETGDLVCRQARGGAGRSILGLHVPFGQGIVGIAAQSQESLLIKDALTDARVYRAADQKTGYVTRSLICAPLVSRKHTLGAVQAINKKVENGQFTQDDLDLLTSLANSAALALENARLYHELQSSYDATLDALASALDLRDRETEGHSRRVVAYTTRLARAYGLPESAMQEVARGALLHDVGKIGVPDSILHKPGLLTPEERDIIGQHPRLGYEMVAIEEIVEGAGRQFDPAVIAVFAKICAAEWSALRQSVMAELETRRARRATGRRTTGDE
ncbi:MAG: GAF domain-containing protein, partial [Chloroflexi bacterium]|nr:GAF domain-containing protein [Chloroflexota bacterium]